MHGTPSSPGAPSPRRSPPPAEDTATRFPVIDLAPLLGDASVWTAADAGTAPPAVAAACAAIAASLASTGCVLVRDPRAGAADAACFLDLLERYFAQAPAAKAADVRPDLHYQVGGWESGGVAVASRRSRKTRAGHMGGGALSSLLTPHSSDLPPPPSCLLSRLSR